MQAEATEARYPISAVAAVTGINPITLRAWERRYGLINPERTAKGHRLYTQQNIDQIHQIQIQLERGIPISQVRLSDDMAIRTSDNENSKDYWQAYIDKMIDGIENFNESLLESTYNHLISLYPIDIVTSRLLIPLLKLLGERWDKKDSGIAEEHFFSTYMRNKLGARFHHRKKYETGPSLLLSCSTGETHEFGLLLFALAAHDHGYRIVLLGPDLPVSQLPIVAAKTRVNAIVVSSSNLADSDSLLDELNTLGYKTSLPVFLGGEIANQHADQVALHDIVPLSQNLSDSIAIVTRSLNQRIDKEQS